MTLATNIEAALRLHLPAELHGAAPVLAQALADALTGAMSPLEAQARLAASPGLASALGALAGREITAGSVRIAFGAGSQVGDVSIGDVAGGSIMKLTLSVGVIQSVSVSGQATVGSIVGVQHNYYTSPSPEERERALRALLHDHSGFIVSRMEAFVGREAELAEIRVRIAEKLPTGGYVTITGQAGQGKSSVIAKLVADALGAGTNLRDQLLEPGAGVPISHFIPFSPGSDHQVGLLRNLIARLCLTYGLPDFYAASDSRPALRDYFAAALRDVAQQGKQEVIYIDGLDQIEEDASGVRDLSFLPEEPPEGIVFVLGTRPNDTLKPLELRKPQHEYWLPALSRADFDLILQHRGVTLTPALADRFYAAMQENALYLDLVARELAQADAIEPEQIIARVADDPANLFSLSIERLQRNEHQWETVLRPILGLLLATRTPLSQRALRALIGVDDLRTRRGLERLGGLIQRDGEGRYGLFHLKLGEFLRQEMFARDEEEGYHQQFVDWCERGKGGIEAIWVDVPGDALEQERRAYARQHYIAHLAAARGYERLWKVIDAGDYGREKCRYDPSAHGYALDLDIGRQACVDAADNQLDQGFLLIVRLWKYSQERCTITSLADLYPISVLEAFSCIGEYRLAINFAELRSLLEERVIALGAITSHLRTLGQDELAQMQLLRARTLALQIEDPSKRNRQLHAIAAEFGKLTLYELGLSTTQSIDEPWYAGEAQCTIIKLMLQAEQWKAALTAIEMMRSEVHQIKAKCAAATILFQASQFDKAQLLLNESTAAAQSLSQIHDQARALAWIGRAYAHTQEQTRASDLLYQALAIARKSERASSQALLLSDIAEVLAEIFPSPIVLEVIQEAVAGWYVEGGAKWEPDIRYLR